MPTGYTADIAKGITFEQYAMSCARAFGALVMMRDEPSDAPIPDAFAPSDYHARAIVEARKKLHDLCLLDGPDLLAAHTAAVKEWQDGVDRREREAQELRQKYEAMLAKAKAYRPPTPDHQKFAEFMVEQIEQSIDFDCKVYRPDRVTDDPIRWRNLQIEAAKSNIAYHEKEHQKEIERTASRNKWIADLRSSLNGGG